MIPDFNKSPIKTEEAYSAALEEADEVQELYTPPPISPSTHDNDNG